MRYYEVLYHCPSCGRLALLAYKQTALDLQQPTPVRCMGQRVVVQNAPDLNEWPHQLHPMAVVHVAVAERAE